MNESIIGQVAEKYGASVPEVNQEIQIAIDEAYQNPSFYARCVYSEGATPTADELISHVVRMVKARCK